MWSVKAATSLFPSPRHNDRPLFQTPVDFGFSFKIKFSHISGCHGVELVVREGWIQADYSEFLVSFEELIQALLLPRDSQDVLRSSGVDFENVVTEGPEFFFQGDSSPGEDAHGAEGDGKELDLPAEEFSVARPQMLAGPVFYGFSTGGERKGGVDGDDSRFVGFSDIEDVIVRVGKGSFRTHSLEQADPCGARRHTGEVDAETIYQGIYVHPGSILYRSEQKINSKGPFLQEEDNQQKPDSQDPIPVIFTKKKSLTK